MTKILNSGHLILAHHSGSDSDIEDAARISYDGHEKKRTPEQNRNLLRYLMQNNHSTPFEMAQYKFKVRAPIFVARQWMRHRTFSYNEISYRYTEPPEMAFYEPEKFRLQDLDNKQQSLENATLTGSNHKEAVCHFNNAIKQCVESYEKMMQLGVAREQARAVLPVGVYTDFYVSGSLRNWFHFCKLRNHSHAQSEIRDYAKAIEDCIAERNPVSYDAYCDYVRDAETLSKQEMQYVRHSQNVFSTIVSALGRATDFAKTCNMRKSETKDFFRKFGIKN